MQRSLARIDQALHDMQRDRLRDALRPGLARDQTRAALEARGLAAPELEELLAWHDGTSSVERLPLGSIWLFPIFSLSSLEHMLLDFDAFRGEPDWSPGWLPVFADGGGDFLVLDATSADQQPIRHFRNDESEHPIEYGSLSDLLATVAVAYDRGIYFVDADGYIDMDRGAFDALAAELNPTIAWWRGDDATA